jgi:hypothetical protein
MVRTGRSQAPDWEPGGRTPFGTRHALLKESRSSGPLAPSEH